MPEPPQLAPLDVDKAMALLQAPFGWSSHGLGLGGIDPDPSCFKLGCEPPQCMVLARGASRTTSSAKRRDEIHWPPNQTPSGPWLRLEILSIKVMNRTGDKGQPCRSPTCTGNRSDLVLAMRLGKLP
ncbi:hypothetical protein ILYODFUR_014247 [Ilyodon furcidens]|uniref:Uncharacterized protein n=1 Tax=Ilyodon furcidens TaxID=33524 RepID=A0ABV0V332_9TELE